MIYGRMCKFILFKYFWVSVSHKSAVGKTRKTYLFVVFCADVVKAVEESQCCAKNVSQFGVME